MPTLLARFATTPVGMSIRSTLRKSMLGRAFIRAVGKGVNREYEQHFHKAIVEALKPGDIVWDIGANVGLYTKLFLDAVGVNGKVIAVEPAPQSAQTVRDLGEADRLIVVEAAVGDVDGTTQFNIGDDATAVTNRVGAGGSHTVRLIRGDTLLTELQTPPTLIKIDVEGFEVHALRGMTNVLKQPSLRALFVEVHFGLLEANGITDSPQRIAALLEPEGFKLDWVDPSHVVARRGAM